MPLMGDVFDLLFMFLFFVLAQEMDGEEFISLQCRHFSFTDKMVKVLFSISTLSWRVNNYVSRQGKGSNRRKDNTIVIIL